MAERESQEPTKKKAPTKKKHLRVVFDTSVLFTGSASDLVRQEVAELVRTSVFPDVEIAWYLPDIVRHERQYQMQVKAIEFLPSVAKVERLLNHRLNITEEILLERVEKTVTESQRTLGLLGLPVQPERIDWARLTNDAVYRRPPFEAGEKEKGFRDALVLESYMQLVEDSPKTPQACRVVLVTGDSVLAEAATVRTRERKNTKIVSSLEELKGLINTLVSEVNEEFVAALTPKAARLFFVKGDQNTFYYKESIRKKIAAQFDPELRAVPEGAGRRTNGQWFIYKPTFVRKDGQRVFWSTRIEIECEARKKAEEINWTNLGRGAVGGLGDFGSLAVAPSKKSSSFSEALRMVGTTPGIFSSLPSVAYKGRDSFSVGWSSELTTSTGLRKPRIEELKHLETRWDPVS